MKHLTVFIISSFLFILLFSKQGFPQYSITDTIQINEVVVTGTPVKVNRNSVPLSVSVVNHEQIEASDESQLLPILNGRVPGLFVTERGVTGFGVATGSAGQVSIRGIGGNPTTGVLMLIDGHPQFMGIMGHPLPDSYVASDVERVEVIRGPASILYGSNAMGGVINIITKKQNKEGINSNGKITFGSFNTRKYMGAVGFKKKKFSAFTSVNHDQTDGHREHSDFKINNGYLKLAYDLNDHFYVSTDVSLAKFKAADPGPDTLNASFGETIDITRGYWAFTLQNEFEKTSGTMKLFYNFGEHDITDGFHSKDHNYGINFFESLHLFKGNNITLGVDYMNYGGLAENGAGMVFADSTISELGTYAFVQQTLAERLIVNAGLRLQHHNIIGQEWIPSVGFSYKLGQETTWKGTISKGYRSPTLRELFMWGTKNPDLKPESIVNYETGFLKTFMDNRINAELTIFKVTGDNLIVAVPVNGASQYQNTGEISNTGIEFSCNAQATKNLLFNATYSFIHMENPVYATPEHHIYLNALFHSGKWQISGTVQQIINLDNEASSVVNKVNYTLVQAKTMYRLNKNLKVYVSAENILNQTYAVNRYYTMPGTIFFAGINLYL